MMHSAGELSFQDHVSWLTNSLASTTRNIYIAEVQDEPVGTVRTDFANGATEFSWTIAPECRGRGFGTQMVKAIMRMIEGPIHVEIKASNTASRRIAESVGLVVVHEADGVVYYGRHAAEQQRQSPLSTS